MVSAIDISKLEYDKIKARIGLFPVIDFPYYSFFYSINQNYDWYEVEKNGKISIVPCVKQFGKFKESVYLEEKLPNDKLVVVSKDLLNRFFIAGKNKIPYFYGYFSNIRFLNREWKNLKSLLLDKILPSEKINNVQLIEQIENFNIENIVED